MQNFIYAYTQMCEKRASIRRFIISSTGGLKDARFSLRTGESGLPQPG
jgi:hypothetical protein